MKSISSSVNAEKDVAKLSIEVSGTNNMSYTNPIKFKNYTVEFVLAST